MTDVKEEAVAKERASQKAADMLQCAENILKHIQDDKGFDSHLPFVSIPVLLEILYLLDFTPRRRHYTNIWKSFKVLSSYQAQMERLVQLVGPIVREEERLTEDSSTQDLFHLLIRVSERAIQLKPLERLADLRDQQANVIQKQVAKFLAVAPWTKPATTEWIPTDHLPDAILELDRLSLKTWQDVDHLFDQLAKDAAEQLRSNLLAKILLPKPTSVPSKGLEPKEFHQPVLSLPRQLEITAPAGAWWSSSMPVARNTTHVPTPSWLADNPVSRFLANVGRTGLEWYHSIPQLVPLTSSQAQELTGMVQHAHDVHYEAVFKMKEFRKARRETRESLNRFEAALQAAGNTVRLAEVRQGRQKLDRDIEEQATAVLEAERNLHRTTAVARRAGIEAGETVSQHVKKDRVMRVFPDAEIELLALQGQIANLKKQLGLSEEQGKLKSEQVTQLHQEVKQMEERLNKATIDLQIKSEQLSDLTEKLTKSLAELEVTSSQNKMLVDKSLVVYVEQGNKLAPGFKVLPMLGAPGSETLSVEMMRRANDTVTYASIRSTAELVESLMTLRNATGLVADTGKLMLVMKIGTSSPWIMQIFENVVRGIGNLERIGDVRSVGSWVPGLLGLVAGGTAYYGKDTSAKEEKEGKEIQAMGEAVAFKEHFRQLRYFGGTTASQQEDLFLHESVNAYLASVFGVQWGHSKEQQDKEAASSSKDELPSACANLARQCGASLIKPFHWVGSGALAMRNVLTSLVSLRWKRRRQIPMRVRIAAGAALMMNMTNMGLYAALAWEGGWNKAITHLLGWGVGGLLVNRLARYLVYTRFATRFLDTKRVELVANYAQSIYMGLCQLVFYKQLQNLEATSKLPPGMEYLEILSTHALQESKDVLIRNLLPMVLPAVALSAQCFETAMGKELESITLFGQLEKIAMEHDDEDAIREQKIQQLAMATIQSLSKKDALVQSAQWTRRLVQEAGNALSDPKQVSRMLEQTILGEPKPTLSNATWCRPELLAGDVQLAAVKGSYEATKAKQDAWLCAMLDMCRRNVF